jgi:hypothetical protein
MRVSGRKFTVRFFATDNEATLGESALKRYHKKQTRLRAGQGKVASEELRAQFFQAIKLADEALGEAALDPAEEGWQFDGSPWIGRRVRRVFPGGVVSEALVQRWLPAGEVAEDVALWHVVHDDGDEEDLEEHELRAAAATIEVAPATPATASAVLRRLDGMAAVRASLVEMRLESYASALEDHGWDDLEYLATLDDERRREIGISVGMKPGHAAKFAARLVKTAVGMAVGIL